MINGFLGALVFSFVFFGVFSLSKIPLSPPLSASPERLVRACTALVFIGAAWLLGRI